MKAYLFSLALIFFVTSAATAQLLPQKQQAQSARAWMGVGIDQGKQGVLIKNVMEKTPAQKAGFKAGDEVLRIDKIVVKTPKEMIDTVGAKGVGVNVTVDYLRDGKEASKTFALEAKPDMDRMQKAQLMNRAAPDFNLPIMYGKHGKLKDFKGNVVMMMFWATWCPACKASLPEVTAISEKYRGQIHVVTIMNEEQAPIKSFFKSKRPPSFEVLQDQDGSTSGKYFVPALPTFVVIDKQGIVRQTTIGGGRYLQEALDAAIKLL